MPNLRKALTDFPHQRERLPVGLAALLQLVALLGIATIVRDHRPNPQADPATWEAMGMFVEFIAIAPLAMLVTMAAIMGAFACQPADAGVRAVQSRQLLAVLCVGVFLIDGELLLLGAWKGIWELFGSMAALAFGDLVLTYAVLRFHAARDSTELQPPIAGDGRHGNAP